MATYYRWRKSTVKDTESTTTRQSVEVSRSSDATIYFENNRKPQISNGEYRLSSSTRVNYATLDFEDPVWVAPQQLTKVCYGGDKLTIRRNSATWGFSNPSGLVEINTISPGPGTPQGYVYSTNSSAYPNGGVSGSYYYDQRTTVTSPTAPTGLTYPATITTPSVSVSWTAAKSNVPNYPVNGYQVDVSTNGGTKWTTAGTPTTNSLSYSIPAGTTSLIFRVRAKDSNGQWGSYVTGTESQVILAPDLTVPQMVMQGQQATISWTAIEGADSYILQRKANTDTDWTQVYSGANLTFSEAVGTWTTVQYRVQAVFDGTPGGWAESAAIPVVSSSALVISGTDENLGVVTNDIPYSISTDTGNQITATITVNNAVIFSGNVGNSTADVIPVLDLITGEGTIVISATVDASGSPVTATRTWTYEKAAITFPNSGSVAQVTKEGENIYPKVLAEGVRLPGGKTLDQVMGFPAQIYTGSYVGTGTSGSSNPTILTFPFEPKIVFIARGTTPSGGSLGTITPMIRGVQQSIVGINGSSRSIAYLTWDNNSLSFYGNGGADTSLNESGITYHYVAIG